jgi:hypothetical protein
MGAVPPRLQLWLPTQAARAHGQAARRGGGGAGSGPGEEDAGAAVAGTAVAGGCGARSRVPRGRARLPHRARRPPSHRAPAPLPPHPPQNNNSKKKAYQRLERELRGFSLSLQGVKMKIGILTAASMFGGMWLINRNFKGVVVAKVEAPGRARGWGGGGGSGAGYGGTPGNGRPPRPCPSLPPRGAHAVCPQPQARPPRAATAAHRTPHQPQPQPPPRRRAQMPFVPHSLFSGLTHMGLPGTDMTEVGAAFFFATTSPMLRANMQKLLGTGPARTATKYLNAPVAVDKKGL